MAADIDIFAGEGNVRGPLIGSVALHVALFALALFGYLIPSVAAKVGAAPPAEAAR